MPSKRKVAKKMKRAINRAKAKGHTKPKKSAGNAENNKVQQQPNEMLLKLMAMMNGGRPGAMDPGAFLAAADKRVKDDAEHKRIINEKKLERQRAADEARKDKQDFELKKAEYDTRVEISKAEHQAKLLKQRLMQLGLEGETAEVKAEIEMIKEQLVEKEGEIATKTLRLQIQKLNAEKEKLKQNPDYKNVSIETKRKLNAAVSKITDLISRLDDFQKNMGALDDNKAELNELEKISAEYMELEKELIELRQRTKFELEQVQESIKSKQDLVNTYRDRKKEHENMKYELELAKEREKKAGVIYETDENGNIMKIENDSKKLPEVFPAENENVKRALTEMNNIKKIITRMYNTSSYFEDYDLKELLELDPFDPKNERERKLDELLVKCGFTGKIGDKMLKARDILGSYQDKRKEYDKVYKNAENEYFKAKTHNEKLELIPNVKERPVTSEMIANINKAISTLKSQLEQTNLKTQLKDDLAKELIKLDQEKQLLEAQVKQTPDIDQDKLTKTIDDIKKIEQEIQRLQQERDVKAVKQRKMNDLQKETAELEFNNNVQRAKLTETEDEKKAREAAEKQRAEAYAEALKQKELNEVKEITHKHEREGRMLELELNAMNSERIKASDDEIARGMATNTYLENRNKQYEELKRLEHKNRESKIVEKANTYVDDMMKGHVKTEDMIGQLKYIQQDVENKTNQALQDKKYIDEKSWQMFFRLNGDPDLQHAVITDYEKTGRDMSNLKQLFTDHDYFRSQMFDRKHTDYMESYFDRLSRTPRTPPPRSRTPPNSPRKEFRFYGPDRVVESTLFDDPSDTE